ncbi:MAG: hypothetical protein Ct9H300mP31_05920 [Acidimicrobiaceae bacterium]|nr:MAG: hypothetical protein Ct9H300mP31_05920 [Acidimicrobiaceae bacterium]
MGTDDSRRVRFPVARPLESCSGKYLPYPSLNEERDIA